MIGAAELRRFAPACDAEAVAPALDAAAAEAGVTTPLRLCHFMAQGAHESEGFTRVVESLNYSAGALAGKWPHRVGVGLAQQIGRTPGRPADQEAIADVIYGGREDLGNSFPGDGWRFRGRGYVQLTGRANYAKAGLALGLDLVDHPELVETPEVAARAFGWFWSSHGLNSLADADDLEGITRKINGGLNGLDDRRALLGRAKAIWMPGHG